MQLLRNAVRPYAWGSRTAIGELLGTPVPTAEPQAELWIGAHPLDPSRVRDVSGAEQSLLDVVATDPDGQLGPGRGEKLPFLLKVLAAARPLSIQAHPSAERAAAGYASEEAAGIPRDAPERNYPDSTAKPELVCALTEFHVLAGFADPARTVELLRGIQSPQLRSYSELLAAQPDAEGLRALFTTLLTLPSVRVAALLPGVLEACERHAAAGGEFAARCGAVLELGKIHPRDRGVLTALLLNRIVLGPGEAIYLPPGNLHVYLRGTAVEIQANSDNVVRGGLTSKHVDVPELLRVVTFDAGRPRVWPGDMVGTLAPRVRVYRTDAPEFELSRIEWDEGEDEPVELGSGPQILLCTSGSASVRSTAGELELRRGASAWLSAGDPPVTLSPVSPAQVFRATVGRK